MAAMPNGITEENHILEVKCPYPARDMIQEESIEKKKITEWEKMVHFITGIITGNFKFKVNYKN